MNLRAVHFIEKDAQVGLNPRPSALCILGFRCSWWHSRQANDVIVSDVFLVKIRIIKVFLCRGESEHTYLVSRCMCWQKLITHTHSDAYTHACTHTYISVFPRGNKRAIIASLNLISQIELHKDQGTFVTT